MPATIARQPDGQGGDYNPKSIKFGAVREKIRRGGSQALTNEERVFVAELFRIAAMTTNQQLIKARDYLASAHLEFCYRLPSQEVKQ